MSQNEIKIFLENRKVKELRDICRDLNIPRAYKLSAKNRKEFEIIILGKNNREIKDTLTSHGITVNIEKDNNSNSITKYLKYISLISLVLGMIYFSYGLYKESPAVEREFKFSAKYLELKKKYPYGFKSFDLRPDGIIIESEKIKESNMNIVADWNLLKFELSSDYYVLSLPPYRLKNNRQQDPNNYIESSDIISEIAIPIKPYEEELLIASVFVEGYVSPFWETLYELDGVTSFVIGFRIATLKDKKYTMEKGLRSSGKIERLEFDIGNY